jgi:hypothetical protein
MLGTGEQAFARPSRYPIYRLRRFDGQRECAVHLLAKLQSSQWLPIPPATLAVAQQLIDVADFYSRESDVGNLLSLASVYARRWCYRCKLSIAALERYQADGK